MKKITLLASALVLGLAAQAQDVLSHSEDQSTFGGGVACADQNTGIATENSFWRSYFTADFDISEDKYVVGAQFAVGTADLAPESGYFVTLNVYTIDGPFPGGDLTLESTQEVEITEGDAGTIKEVLLADQFLVSFDQEVVIEVYDNDETVNFRIGMNEEGETAPSYLSSEACGIDEPVAIGTGPLEDFADNIIINMVVNDELSIEDQISASEVSLYPNPASDIVNVNVPSSVEITGATLYDVLGKDTGVAIDNGQLNVSNLSRGVYMLSLETTNGSLTKRVIKK